MGRKAGLSSSIKKRFKITSNGKIKVGVTCKQHRMLHKRNALKNKGSTRLLSKHELNRIMDKIHRI